MENQPGQKPFLRFIYLNHGEEPRNWDYLMRLFTDVDVVFQEYSCRNQSVRDRYTEEFNLISSRTEELSLKERLRQLEHLIEWNEKHMIGRLMARLGNSGKQVVLVDVDEDHPAVKLEKEIQQQQLQVFKEVERGDLATALAILLKLSGEVVIASRMREETVQQQVTDFSAKWKREKNTPLRAAVVQGAAHWPTADLFSTDGFDVEKEMLDNLPSFLTTWVRLRLGEEIAENEFKRGLLSGYLLPFSTSLFDLRRGRSQPGFDALVEQLSDEQVPALLDHYEKLRRQGWLPGAAAGAVLGLAKDWASQNRKR
jgi:hypothetical protein